MKHISKLECWVNSLYPYHNLADAVEFAYRAGKISWSCWAYMTKNESREDREENLGRRWINPTMKINCNCS